MANQNSQVDLAGLKAAASSQEQAVDAGQQQLVAMVNHGEMLAQTWKGDAAKKFEAALADFGNQAETVLSRLHDMADLMNNTHSVFQTVHWNTTGQMDQARAAMTGLPGL